MNLLENKHFLYGNHSEHHNMEIIYSTKDRENIANYAAQ